MNDQQEYPSPQMWLNDFKAIAASRPVTVESVKETILPRYPDSGWAEEYAFSLFCASKYLLKNTPHWERLGLAVIGENQSIIKDCVPAALYWHFLRGSLADRIRGDISVEQVAKEARELEIRFPGK